MTEEIKTTKKKKKKAKVKKMEYRTKIRILLGALGLVFCVFVFILVHYFEVVRQAGDRDSDNARMGRLNPGVSREEIEADDRRFPMHPSPSAGPTPSR